MDLMRAIQKIIPGWQGAVWNNSYDQIKPHHAETRQVPTMEELEVAWATIQKEDEDLAFNESIKAQLADIDLKTIRALRAGEADMIAQREAEAIALREKLRVTS